MLDVKGYEGLYLISRDGDIYSKHRGKYLKPYLNPCGYLGVKLCKNGKNTSLSVHRILASTYSSPVEGRTEVNHIDGNKLNNSLDNLEWCTRSENMRHAHKVGLVDLKGDKGPNAKLTEEQVLKIRKSSARGTLLANEYGVTKHTIYDIRKRKSWKHI